MTHSLSTDVSTHFPAKDIIQELSALFKVWTPELKGKVDIYTLFSSFIHGFLEWPGDVWVESLDFTPKLGHNQPFKQMGAFVLEVGGQEHVLGLHGETSWGQIFGPASEWLPSEHKENEGRWESQVQMRLDHENMPQGDPDLIKRYATLMQATIHACCIAHNTPSVCSTSPRPRF